MIQIEWRFLEKLLTVVDKKHITGKPIQSSIRSESIQFEKKTTDTCLIGKSNTFLSTNRILMKKMSISLSYEINIVAFEKKTWTIDNWIHYTVNVISINTMTFFFYFSRGVQNRKLLTYTIIFQRKSYFFSLILWKTSVVLTFK